jgi:hypothetical protein
MVTIDFSAPLPGGGNRPCSERALMHGQSAVTFKEMFFN